MPGTVPSNVWALVCEILTVSLGDRYLIPILQLWKLRLRGQVTWPKVPQQVRGRGMFEDGSTWTKPSA